MRRLLFVLVAVSLQGCFVGVSATSPVYASPVLELVLTAPLRIPAGTAHVTFQDGQVVGSADRYRPYCEFEIDAISQQPQEVPPGRFEVRSSAYRTLSDELAGIPAFPVFSLDCSDGIYYESRWRLRSRHYPGARVLICREVFDACRPGRYPGPPQIRQALGDWFELKSPEIPAP